ncbi:MAG: Rpn family recombination-promoting nuclease/putative transposase [Clostridiaceae bacterium]
MPIRLLLYMIEIWREILKDTENKKFRQKSFKLPAVVPIVLYNGSKRWTAAKSLKEVISNSEIFEENILDFKYTLLDINRYEKEELYKKDNISSAIFLLDQDVDRIEFYDRLKDIVVRFSKLTVEEKAYLKHWLVNANLDEDNFKDNIEKIFSANKGEVLQMTSNISKGLEKLKEEGAKEKAYEIAKKAILKGLDNESISDLTGLSVKEIENLRKNK